MTDAPLVPLDVDLSDFPYMPVDISRLLGSEFHARSSDAGWRAGFTLWLRSYHQVPAGSVPDDEVALARLAELGRDVKAWRKIRAEALHGWVKCSDGRLYHPVVAEKVLEGWIEKLTQRKSSLAGNAKRYGSPFDPAPIDAQIDECKAKLTMLNPLSRLLTRRPRGVASNAPDHLPPGDENTPTGTPDSIPTGSDDERGNLRQNRGSRVNEPITIKKATQAESDPATSNESDESGKAKRHQSNDAPGGTPGGTPDHLPHGSQEKGREGINSSSSVSINGNGRPEAAAPPDPDQDADLFRRGKKLLGKSAGGQISKLKAKFDGSIPKARAVIEIASTKASPAEYVAAVIRGSPADERPQLYDRGL